MKGTNDIRNELRELNSPLADMPAAMPYEVPDGYFESFSTAVPLMMAGKGMPHEVPQAYFENFAGSVMAKIAATEIHGNMSVPEGYFDAFPTRMLEVVKAADKKQKPVSLAFTVWRNVRWAAAAVLVLGIGMGVYRSYIYQPAFNVGEELASVSQDVISEYVQQHIDEFDVETLANGNEFIDMNHVANHLSDEEIENYINEGGL